MGVEWNSAWHLQSRQAGIREEENEKEGDGGTMSVNGTPFAATMKSKKETRPILAAGESGCTPRTLYPTCVLPAALPIGPSLEARGTILIL